MLGRQLEDLFPLAFLPRHHALAVAIMSYNGGIDYGLLGDYDALPDIDLIADGIDVSLHELLDAAPRARRSSESKPPARPSAAAAGKDNGTYRNGDAAPILPTASTRRERGPAADMRAKRSRRAGSPRKPAAE